MSARRFLFLLTGIIALFVAAAGYGLAASVPVSIPPPAVSVSIERGSAELRRAGTSSTEPIGAATVANVGDAVAVAPDSLATLSLNDLAFVVADGGTVFRLRRFDSDPRFRGAVRSVVELESGRLTVTWRGEHPGNRIAFETPELRIAGPRGNAGSALISADAAKTMVAALSGDPVTVWTRSPSVDAALVPHPPLESFQTLLATATGVLSRRPAPAALRDDPFLEESGALASRFDRSEREQVRSDLVRLAGQPLAGGPGYWLKRFGETFRIALMADRAARLDARFDQLERRFAELLLDSREASARRYEHAREHLKRIINTLPPAERDAADIRLAGWYNGTALYWAHRLGRSEVPEPGPAEDVALRDFDATPEVPSRRPPSESAPEISPTASSTPAADTTRSTLTPHPEVVQ